MDVKDVMTRNVQVVAPEATLQEAAAHMRDLNVGSLPVCNGRRLLGMVTDRDLAIRAVADGRDPRTTAVREVMTPDVIYAYDDEAVAEISERMAAHQIRRLPIVSREHDLVGIVALGDLAVSVADDQGVEQVLEDVSQPARPTRSGKESYDR